MGPSDEALNHILILRSLLYFSGPFYFFYSHMAISSFYFDLLNIGVHV